MRSNKALDLGGPVRIQANSALRDDDTIKIQQRRVHATGKGRVDLINFRLQDGLGAARSNLWLLETSAALCLALEESWVEFGDRNMDPTMPSAAGWAELVSGKILAPSNATCAGGTITCIDGPPGE